MLLRAHALYILLAQLKLSPKQGIVAFCFAYQSLPRPHLLTIHLFCDAERLSLCRRGHSFRRDDTDMLVFCFAERPHAEQFQTRFGGEFIDPTERPTWPMLEVTTSADAGKKWVELLSRLWR